MFDLKLLKNGYSAWDKGVRLYATELLENVEREPVNVTDLKQQLLNGASNWKQYSEGGSALVYDGDIAERLCTPSELVRNHHGEKDPSRNRSWLDVQASALNQAAQLILKSYTLQV